jgi:hypothetical protein
MVRQSLTTGSGAFGGIGFSTIDDSNNSGQYDAARIAIINESTSAVLSGTAMVFYTQVGSVSNTNAATEQMRINSVGNVTVTGTITSNSDARLKTNVTTITGALDKVLALRGVMFDRITTGAHEMGTIAQEVEVVVPELVFTDENGIKSVAYANTVALLIEAIKEQQVQINELKGRL